MASDPPEWVFAVWNGRQLPNELPWYHRIPFEASGIARVSGHASLDGPGLEARATVKVSGTASLTAIGPGHGGGIATLG